MVNEAMPPRWLWHSACLALTLTLFVGVVLSAAIGVGWNAPHPAPPPAWQIAGPLTLAATPSNTVVRLLNRPASTFTLEAEALPNDLVDPSSYGLVFRAHSAHQYDVFAIGTDGYLAVLRIDGAEETALLDWQTFPHVRRGESTNRLRISCAEGTCRFWVNDEYAASLPDHAGSPSDVGLWVRCTEGEAGHVSFAQITVWEEN